ncbi:MAG: acyltransferase family protein [Muribaculaceae bacterium]|nr:acyltransferase family protein [Muribaculaceae bacterium]
MQGRLREFDLLKGIGILLVILGHIHIPSDLFCSLIYGVHMPLFFFVSGLLYIFSSKNLLNF